MPARGRVEPASNEMLAGRGKVVLEGAMAYSAWAP